ncbi:MAG: aminoacyl-tRNA hydrolase [Verrucomicrobiota bacterium]
MSFPLIIGLGNPGRQYEDTRHNVGFMILDRLAAASGAVFSSTPKWQSHFAKLADGTVLLKPQAFMNLSGRAVHQIAAFHKWQPSDMLVVYDDAALPLGTLRFRERGSAGGHNGIRSLIEHLGTDSFARLKVGIGGGAPGKMVGHVLGKFTPEEQGALENTLASAVDAVQFAHAKGIAIAANHYNAPANPSPPSHPDESQLPRPDRP